MFFNRRRNILFTATLCSLQNADFTRRTPLCAMPIFSHANNSPKSASPCYKLLVLFVSSSIQPHTMQSSMHPPVYIWSGISNNNDVAASHARHVCAKGSTYPSLNGSYLHYRSLLALFYQYSLSACPCQKDTTLPNLSLHSSVRHPSHKDAEVTRPDSPY